MNRDRIDEIHLFDDDIAVALNAYRKRASIARPALFYGSSTIRLWETISSDLDDPSVVGVGCGGGTCISGMHYLDQVMDTVDPACVFLYFGQNDISVEGLTGKAAALRWMQLADQLRLRLPTQPIVALSVKYSPARWHLAPEIDRMNELVKAEVEKRPRFHWIELNSALLGMNGNPAERYFADDRIHLNHSGYLRIAHVIRNAWPLHD